MAKVRRASTPWCSVPRYVTRHLVGALLQEHKPTVYYFSAWISASLDNACHHYRLPGPCRMAKKSSESQLHSYGPCALQPILHLLRQQPLSSAWEVAWHPLLHLCHQGHQHVHLVSIAPSTLRNLLVYGYHLSRWSSKKFKVKTVERAYPSLDMTGA